MYVRIIVTLVMVIVLGTGVAQAQNFGAPLGAFFRLEWEVERARSGRPTITGYIYNDHDYWISDLQLLVEQLDRSGRVVSKTIGYVDGDVPNGGRRYFEVPVPMMGATYRVTVHSFDFMAPGPGGS